ncbi:MAG: J domain-containing protein [Desulfosoma sp.]
MSVTNNATPKDYQLLGLEPGASFEDVKRAYRELAKKWHPDLYADSPEWARLRAEEKFKDLQEAYHRILNHPLPNGSGDKEVFKERRRRAPEKGSPSEPRQQESRRFGFFRNFSLDFSGKWIGAVAVLAVAVLWIFWAVGHKNRFQFSKIGPEKPGASVAGESRESATFDVPSQRKDLRLPSLTIPLQDLDASESGKVSPKAPLDRAETFGLGSTERDVLRVQGSPDRRNAGRWAYGLSEVRFQDGRVVGYDNFDGRLRVFLKPSDSSIRKESMDFFTLGSTKDEVLRVQGTPTGIRGALWHYGFSSVRFVEDRVAAYDNAFGNLKVRLLPSQEYLAKSGGKIPSFFTIGSSADEVLAVQGTPTSIRGNVWFYHFSDVLFRNGRVGWVNDPEGRLRFVEREALSEGPRADRE